LYFAKKQIIVGVILPYQIVEYLNMYGDCGCAPTMLLVTTMDDAATFAS
jgi:hypothetical protein